MKDGKRQCLKQHDKLTTNRNHYILPQAKTGTPLSWAAVWGLTVKSQQLQALSWGQKGQEMKALIENQGPLDRNCWGWNWHFCLTWTPLDFLVFGTLERIGYIIVQLFDASFGKKKVIIRNSFQKRVWSPSCFRNPQEKKNTSSSWLWCSFSLQEQFVAVFFDGWNLRQNPTRAVSLYKSSVVSTSLSFLRFFGVVKLMVLASANLHCEFCLFTANHCEPTGCHSETFSNIL